MLDDDFEYDDDIFINASATASAYLSVYDDDPLYKPSDLYTSQHHNFDISDSHMIAEVKCTFMCMHTESHLLCIVFVIDGEIFLMCQLISCVCCL